MATTDPAQCESRSILVVEDDEELQAAMLELLRELGFRAEAVPNGQVALERLRAMPAAPSLIILNLSMPVMDGQAFRAEQRRQAALRSIPVLLYTADRDVEKWAAELGVQGYLRKPIGARELAPLVLRHCAGSSQRL